MKPWHYVVLALIITIGVFFWAGRVQGGLDWVRGAYGKVCTLKGQESPRIKYKMYYGSFEECDKAATPFK